MLSPYSLHFRRHRFPSAQGSLPIFLSFLALAGCTDPKAKPPGNIPNAGEGEVSAVAVSASNVLVDEGGALCQQLVATASGASGAVLDVPVAWESSDETVATVDNTGKVCGNSAGSATVLATASGVSSGGVQVTTAPLADGVIPVYDSEVLSAPEIIAGGPNLDDLEIAYIASGTAPAVGTIIVAVSDAAILGRVLRTEPADSGTRVVFEVVAPWEALDGPLALDIPMDSADAKLADLGDQATISLDAEGWYRVTPTEHAATGPLLSCKTDGSLSELKVQGSAALRVTGLTLHTRFDAPGEWSVRTSGTLEQDASLSVVASSGISGEVDCKVEIASIPVPVGGWLTYVVGGMEVPVGVSVALEPELALVSGEIVSWTAKGTVPFDVGLEMRNGTASLCCDAPAPPTSGTEFTFVDMSALDVEAKVGLYAYAELRLAFAEIFSSWEPFSGDAPGAPPRAPDYTLAIAKVGVVAGLKWQPLVMQLTDANSAGSWTLDARANVGLGSDLNRDLEDSATALLGWAGGWWGLPDTISIDASLTSGVEIDRSPELELTEIEFVGPIATFNATSLSSSPLPPLNTLEWWCRRDGAWVAGELTNLEGKEVTCPDGTAVEAIAASSTGLGLSFEAGMGVGFVPVVLKGLWLMESYDTNPFARNQEHLIDFGSEEPYSGMWLWRCLYLPSDLNAGVDWCNTYPIFKGHLYRYLQSPGPAGGVQLTLSWGHGSSEPITLDEQTPEGTWLFRHPEYELEGHLYRYVTEISPYLE